MHPLAILAAHEALTLANERADARIAEAHRARQMRSNPNRPGSLARVVPALRRVLLPAPTATPVLSR